MSRGSDIGFITMAFGPEKYFRQAETLARSIRRHMPTHKIALVTDRKSAGDLFDILVPMRDFDEAGTVHKADMYSYSPFDETLFIDSDCVVARGFHDELAAIRKYDFTPIVGAYLLPNDNDLWLQDVGVALAGVGGRSFPKFNGGVYFFRKGDHAAEVFRRSKEIRLRSKELGIIDFDKSGPGEETLIGLALAGMGETQLYFDGGKLMRTPLNSSGPLVMDPIRGVCHFVKEGVFVEPAICHYCGPWIDHPTYRLAELALRRGRRPSAITRMAYHAKFQADILLKKIKRRWPRSGQNTH